MHPRVTSLVALIALLMLAGCAKPEAPPPPKTDFSDEASAAIAKGNDAFIQGAKAGDAALLVRDYYADDAVLLPPEGGVVEGKAKIQEYFAGLMKEGQIVDLKFNSHRIVASGNVASEAGRFEETVRMGDKDVTYRGKYNVTWQRGSDGNWRAVIDAFNMEPPPAPAAKKP